MYSFGIENDSGTALFLRTKCCHGSSGFKCSDVVNVPYFAVPNGYTITLGGRQETLTTCTKSFDKCSSSSSSSWKWWYWLLIGAGILVVVACALYCWCSRRRERDAFAFQRLPVNSQGLRSEKYGRQPLDSVPQIAPVTDRY